MADPSDASSTAVLLELQGLRQDLQAITQQLHKLETRIQVLVILLGIALGAVVPFLIMG